MEENNSKKLNSSILKENCRFCNPPDTERILKNTKNFYVMLSLGPIVEGYMLLISKQHIPSFQDLPEHLVPEFLTIKKMVRGILTKEYGSCLFFEHNLSSTSITKKDTFHDYHAHLHCVPSDVDILEDIRKVLIAIPIESWDSLEPHAARFSESIYYENNNGDMYIFPVDKYLQKQFLRCTLAKKLKVPERADWTIYSGREDIFTAKNKLTPLFDTVLLKWVQ